MKCLASEVTNAVLGTSSRYHAVTETCQGPVTRYQVSVRGCLVSLTCACGTRCILRYSREARAASWALSFLTVTTDVVRGALQQANCVTLWPNSGHALSVLVGPDGQPWTSESLWALSELGGSVDPGQGDGGST